MGIGSGARELVGQFQKWDNEYAGPPLKDFDLESSHFISEVIGAHRNRKLFFHTRLESTRDWGGYLESFIVENDNFTWVTTSDWVHLQCDFDGRKYFPSYPYFIYKRCEDGIQRLFKVGPADVEVWEIEAPGYAATPRIERYFGPFGPQPKITISYVSAKTDSIYHSTSMYYQDGRFSVTDPMRIQDLDSHYALFEMMGVNIAAKVRRGES